MTGQDIVDKAREMLGTPFHHQGHSLHGTDCAGVVRWVYRELGFGDPVVEAYQRQPDGLTMMRLMREYGRQVDFPHVGDVLVMRMGRHPQHLAIKTDKGILHAYQSYGKVTEHALDERFARLVVAQFRFPGVE